MQYIKAVYISKGGYVKVIFVTLGSQKFQFNRMLKVIDELIEKGVIKEEVFAQTGASDYEPKNYKYKAFLDRNQFADIMEKSHMVITHGGTGAIIGAVKKGKKVIAVPRLAKYGEHVDDHQLQLLKQFDELGIICPCYDLKKLGKCYEEIGNMTFNKYESNTQTIISSIEEFIESI